MKVCVVGAGAIGGGVGGLLHRAGHEVTLVARGAHLEALGRGLRLCTPQGVELRSVPTSPVPLPADLQLLCVKSQDTAEALEVMPPRSRVATLQNGIENEALVEAAGHTVLPVVVFVPATHLVPGEVRLHGAPHPGYLDTGDEDLAELFRQAGFRARVRRDVMAWKRGKLLSNLGGALQLLGPELVVERYYAMVAEAEAVFEAAGLSYVPLDELVAACPIEVAEVDGKTRDGGSTWQSHVRGRPLEIEHLQGTIERLGVEVGVPTPACSALLRQLRRSRPGPRR